MYEIKILKCNKEEIFPVQFKIKFSSTVSGMCKTIKFNRYTINLIGLIVVDTNNKKYDYNAELILKNVSLTMSRVDKNYTFDWRPSDEN